MERLSAPERTREELRALMNGDLGTAAGRGDLVRLALRLIVEEALEGEVADVLGRERYERGDGEKAGYRRYHVVPSGPSAVKLGGEHGTYASANPRGCRTGSFGGDRAQQDDLASRRLRSVYKQGISSPSGWR